MMKASKILFTFLSLWLLITGQIHAQMEQSARIEFITSNDSEENFDVTPLKGSLLVTHRKNEFYKDENWVFYSYDTTLKERWHTEYKLDKKFKPTRSFNNQNFLYWLFEDDDTDKFMILRLDLIHGETDSFEGKMPTHADVFHFKVLGNVAYLAGYYDVKPIVMGFSFFDKSIKILPYLFMPNTEISNLEIDEIRNELTVILYTLKGRNCQFTLKVFSYEGRLLKTTAMPTENGNSLISGKIMPFENENSLLIGNYSQGCTQYSQGLYFSRILNGEPESLQWVDFGQLENFFNYLKPKRKQRMVDRIVRRKAEGKDPKFRYRLLVHDIMPTDDELVFVAEVFYQSSQTSNRNSFNSVRFSNQHIDAYRYTHAIICGFDKTTGKLLWDNCLPIDDLENLGLHKMVQVMQQDGKLILAYPKEGKIHTEVIQKNRVLREQQEFEIKPVTTDEKITENDDELMAAWFKNSFVVFGYQKIRNEKASSREVFFVNKLIYDTNIAPQPTETKKRK